MSLKKNVIANYCGAAWSALMALAFVPLYIKYLGIEAYGLIGVFAMLQGWLWLLDMGMTPALSREMARCNGGVDETQSLRNLLRSVEMISICIAIASAVCIWAAMDWIAADWLKVEKLSIREVANAFAIMGLVIALRFVENIYRASLIGLQRQVLLNIISSLMATVRGLGAVGVLVLIAPTIEAFFLWQGLVSMATLGLFSGVVYRVLPAPHSRSQFSLPALRKIGRFAAGTTAITFLSILLTQVDKIMLSRLLSLEAFGYYAFAVVVAQTPFVVVGPVVQAFSPRFVKLLSEDNETDLIVAYHTATQLITVLLGSATVLLAFFGTEILELWTRDIELTKNTYMLVVVLSLGTLLNGLVTIPHHLQLASGWTELIIRVNIVAAMIVVPALFFIIPVYGAIGAGWIWALLNISYVVVHIQLMHRRLLPSEKWRWYFYDVCGPLAAAIVAALFLREITPDSSGILLKIAKLVICFFIILVSATLAAPIVRRHVLFYIPASLKLAGR